MKKKKLPQKIYLQIGEDCDCVDFSKLSDVTWCKDKIFKNDLEYVSIDYLYEVEKERDEAINELVKFNPKIRVTHEEEPMYLKFKKITYVPPNQIHFVHKEGTLLDKIINIGQDSTKTDEK